MSTTALQFLLVSRFCRSFGGFDLFSALEADKVDDGNSVIENDFFDHARRIQDVLLEQKTTVLLHDRHQLVGGNLWKGGIDGVERERRYRGGEGRSSEGKKY